MIAKLLRKVPRRIARSWQESKFHYSPRHLWGNLADVDVDRPVFFLGCQGAGITLISRVLRLHRDVVYLCGNHETWTFKDEIHNAHSVIGEIIPESLSLRSPGYDNVIPSMENHDTWGYERTWLYASEPFLDRYRRTAKDAAPDDREALLRIIRTSILVHRPGPRAVRFTDMSQSFAVRLPYVNELLDGFDPQYVVVVRDPYALIKRELDRGLSGFRYYRKQPDKDLLLRRLTEHYANLYGLLLEDVGTIDNVTVITFEDFLENPPGVAESLCGAVDLAFRESMMPSDDDRLPWGSREPAKWYPIRRDVNRKYRECLEGDERAEIERRCGELLERFDYQSPIP